jgi:hypothetical protein
VTDTAIPLADGATFRSVATRTRVVRIVLAAALLGLVVAAVLVARGPRIRPVPPLPVGSSGIVVLDLSASVESNKAKRMYTAISQLASTKGGRFGLVIFAGWAYQALPPGTPARELASVARFFLPQKPPPGVTGYTALRPYFPRNPWAQAFATGTTISTGLNLAREIILASKLNSRSVILISDLADVATDVPLAVAAAQSYRDLGIAFHVVGVNAAFGNAQFWQRLVGQNGSFTRAETPANQRLRTASSFPVWLAVLAVLTAALLAINEFWGVPLRWGSRVQAEQGAT